MFSGIPGVGLQTQEVGSSRAIVRKYQYFEKLIEPIAKTMMSEFDKLKNALDLAVTAYLSNIENKWFCNSERERAEKFRNKLSAAKSLSALLPALEEVIKKGDENEDSLIAFIYKGINLNFNLNNIYKNNSYPALSYTDTLGIIVSELKKQLEPICMKTFSDSSGVNTNPERNLQQNKI